MKRMLVAASDPNACKAVSECFKATYDVQVVGSGTECVELFQAEPYEFVFIDIELFATLAAAEDARSYRNTLTLFWNIFPPVQIIMLCSQANIRKAVEAMQAGATNYLVYPVDRKEARYVVQSTYAAIRMQSELDYLRDQFWRSDSSDVVRTGSREMQEVFAKARTVAPSDTTVLISGETGTGKGVLANLIHRHGSRRAKQFISVHCGAIPDSLIESEMFGHERGAFTGAVRRKLGKFEVAQGGTIFLDEIGTMPLGAQVKLLQVLQDRTYQRVGGEDTITSNVRVIAASNTNLAAMTEAGEFRRDLYYRLNVFPIELPPLRRRIEDVPILVELFLERLNRSHPKRITLCHPDALKGLQAYSWPGNIRELENLVERAFLLEPTDMLTPASFPTELFVGSDAVTVTPLDISLTLAQTRAATIARAEEDYLQKQLAANQGRIAQTAAAAGVSPRQLHKLLTRHGIRKEAFKASPPSGARRVPT
jgi:DNA-binding NtrC family response regulator